MPLDFPLPTDGGALLIDNSFLEWFTTCPRGAEYSRVRKRIPAISKPALAFGGAIHAALAVRYGRGDVVFSPETWPLQMDALEKHFAENPIPPDDFRNVNWAAEVLKRYNERYMIEPFSMLKLGDKVFVEQPFLLPLFVYENPPAPPLPVMYMGRIDMAVTWDSQVFVPDHKTTSMLGPTYFDDLRVSPQQVGYCWAFEQVTGVRPAGFVINAIRVRAQPDKPKGGVAAWWEESFQRHKEYLLPHTISEWKTNTIALVEEFMWQYNRGFFPQKKKWCCAKYGRCPYYDVCDSAPDVRGVMLSSGMFADNTWSPLNPSAA